MTSFTHNRGTNPVTIIIINYQLTLSLLMPLLSLSLSSITIITPRLSSSYIISILIIMSIPCVLWLENPGLYPWERGYNKSPRVPGLSVLSSYKDSTFLIIFAVPNNAVVCTTSNPTFTPIRFMYSLKLTDTTPRAPITTGTTMTFRMRQTFAISFLN